LIRESARPRPTLLYCTLPNVFHHLCHLAMRLGQHASVVGLCLLHAGVTQARADPREVYVASVEQCSGMTVAGIVKADVRRYACSLQFRRPPIFDILGVLW